MCIIPFFPSVRRTGTSGDAFYWEEQFAYNSVITGFVTSPRMVVLSGHDVTRGCWTKSTSASTACAAAFWKTRLCTQSLFVLCSVCWHPLCPSLAPRPGHVTRLNGLKLFFFKFAQYSFEQKCNRSCTRNIGNDCNHLQCARECV